MIGERFGSKMFDPGIGVQLRKRPQFHEAEPARVIIGDRCAVLHVKHDMIMRRICAGIMMELCGRGAVDREPP